MQDSESSKTLLSEVESIIADENRIKEIATKAF